MQSATLESMFIPIEDTQSFRTLPIQSHIPTILNLIQTYPVTSIVCPPGNGVNIALPMNLIQNIQSTNNRVLVGVYDDDTAKTLYNIANSSPYIGYVSKDQTIQSEHTLITYTTLDYIVHILSQSTIISPTLIILDKYSGDSPLYNLIIQLSSQIKQIKVVVVESSSTTEDIARYDVNLNVFPVQIQYHSRNYKIMDLDLISDTVDVITSFHTSRSLGDILVLVPSKGDADNIKSRLTLDNTSIITQPEIKLSESSTNQHIYILTPDLAMSLAIKKIYTIIDTMIIPHIGTNYFGGIKRKYIYTPPSISLDHARYLGSDDNQLYYRMCTQDFFTRIKEVRNTYIPLDLILYAYMSNQNSVVLADRPNDLMSQRLSDKKWLESVVKILEQNQSYLKLLKSTTLPLGILNSIILSRCISSDIPLFPCICLLSILESYEPSMLLYPLKSVNMSNYQYQVLIREHGERHFKRFEGISSLHTLCNIFVTLLDEVGGIDATYQDIIEWCRINSINSSIIQSCINLIRDIISILNANGYTVDVGPFTTEGIINAMTSHFIDVYSDSLVQLVVREDLYDPFISGVVDDERVLDTLTYITYTDGQNVYHLDNRLMPSMLYATPSYKLLVLFKLSHSIIIALNI